MPKDVCEVCGEHLRLDRAAASSPSLTPHIIRLIRDAVVSSDLLIADANEVVKAIGLPEDAAPAPSDAPPVDLDWALRELADGWITNNEREGPYGFYQNARRVLELIIADCSPSDVSVNEAAREIVTQIETEREPHPEWSSKARAKYVAMAVEIITKHLRSTPVGKQRCDARCENCNPACRCLKPRGHGPHTDWICVDFEGTSYLYCSCGAACTKEEYQQHLAMGHNAPVGKEAGEQRGYVKACPHGVVLDAATPPVPIATHEFQRIPNGLLRYDRTLDKCWKVINMIYCGLPVSAPVHSVPAAEPLEIVDDGTGINLREPSPRFSAAPAVAEGGEGPLPWVDEGGHVWDVRRGVDCVECPHCCFTFAAIHGNGDTDGYSCPNCEGCPDTRATPSPVDHEKQARALLRDLQQRGFLDDEIFEHPQFDDSLVVWIITTALQAAAEVERGETERE
jgi:hypothetical protein